MEKPSGTILLMRHAQSVRGGGGLHDFDRPLNECGRNDAPKMGKYLKGLDVIPDQIFCSPAVRAKETSVAFTKGIGVGEDLIKWNKDFYDGGVDNYIWAIQQADEQHQTVMTVGHNPMIERLIGILSGEAIRRGVPPATIACFEATVGSWRDIKPGACTLKWLVTPKNIR